VASRKNAVLRISRPGTVEDSALDREREYAFELRVDGRPATGGTFTPTLGDERWTTFIHALNRATAASVEEAREARGPLTTVRDVGRKLYDYLTRLAPELSAFLETERGPRRLVIESAHSEIHKLPWEAMVRPDWTIPAEGDVSIVHTKPLFRSDPLVCQTPLRVAAVFGPNTGRTTADALTGIATDAADRIDVRTWQTAAATNPPDADIYHVEAHGSRETGGIDIDDEVQATTPLAERLRDRAMVLLWSCHSALARSWGGSPAFTLNERGNALIVAFQTELHEDSAADIASRFYHHVFKNRDVADPETAIVRERSRLYKARLNSCEWAALAAWLRQPIDVTAAALDGPRLPDTSWSDVPGSVPGGGGAPPLRNDQQLLEFTLDEEAHPGRALLVTGVTMTAPLPRELVAAYRGTIVHVDGDLRSGSGLKEVVKALGLTPRSPHPADALLSVIDALGAIPESLVLWTGVDDDQQRAAGLIAIPRGMRIVLTSPLPLTAVDGLFLSARSAQPSARPNVPAVSPVDELERLERTGRYPDAYGVWDSQRGVVHGWPVGERRRYWVSGYWIGVRLEHELSNLEQCLSELDALDPFVGTLLRGNLRDRAGDYDQARRQYAEAQRLAQTDTEKGWLRIEMAYLAGQLGDPTLADAHYRAALRLLESVPDGDADPLWRSALGRGLRDYAHLLARDKNRAAEAAARLDRAIAMHAIDGRLGQLAAALTTRGRLERTLDRWDRGERALHMAVSLQHASGNVRGWASSVQDLAHLHFDAGRYELALQLVTSVYARLEGGVDPVMRPAAGLSAWAAARAAWRLGRFAEARAWIDEALQRLPAERRDERSELETLSAVVQSLSPESSPAGP
jgi:tetratricopeptide (TPR) repeat protein